MFDLEKKTYSIKMEYPFPDGYINFDHLENDMGDPEDNDESSLLKIDKRTKFKNEIEKFSSKSLRSIFSDNTTLTPWKKNEYIDEFSFGDYNLDDDIAIDVKYRTVGDDIVINDLIEYRDQNARNKRFYFDKMYFGPQLTYYKYKSPLSSKDHTIINNEDKRNQFISGIDKRIRYSIFLGAHIVNFKNNTYILDRSTKLDLTLSQKTINKSKWHVVWNWNIKELNIGYLMTDEMMSCVSASSTNVYNPLHRDPLFYITNRILKNEDEMKTLSKKMVEEYREKIVYTKFNKGGKTRNILDVLMQHCALRKACTIDDIFVIKSILYNYMLFLQSHEEIIDVEDEIIIPIKSSNNNPISVTSFEFNPPFYFIIDEKIPIDYKNLTLPWSMFKHPIDVPIKTIIDYLTQSDQLNFKFLEFSKISLEHIISTIELKKQNIKIDDLHCCLCLRILDDIVCSLFNGIKLNFTVTGIALYDRHPFLLETMQSVLFDKDDTDTNKVLLCHDDNNVEIEFSISSVTARLYFLTILIDDFLYENVTSNSFKNLIQSKFKYITKILPYEQNLDIIKNPVKVEGGEEEEKEEEESMAIIILESKHKNKTIYIEEAKTRILDEEVISIYSENDEDEGSLEYETSSVDDNDENDYFGKDFSFINKMDLDNGVKSIFDTFTDITKFNSEINKYKDLEKIGTVLMKDWIFLIRCSELFEGRDIYQIKRKNDYQTFGKYYFIPVDAKYLEQAEIGINHIIKNNLNDDSPIGQSKYVSYARVVQSIDEIYYTGIGFIYLPSDYTIVIQLNNEIYKHLNKPGENFGYISTPITNATVPYLTYLKYENIENTDDTITKDFYRDLKWYILDKEAPEEEIPRYYGPDYCFYLNIGIHDEDTKSSSIDFKKVKDHYFKKLAEFDTDFHNVNQNYKKKIQLFDEYRDKTIKKIARTNLFEEDENQYRYTRMLNNALRKLNHVEIRYLEMIKLLVDASHYSTLCSILEEDKERAADIKEDYAGYNQNGFWLTKMAIDYDKTLWDNTSIIYSGLNIERARLSKELLQIICIRGRELLLNRQWGVKYSIGAYQSVLNNIDADSLNKRLKVNLEENKDVFLEHLQRIKNLSTRNGKTITLRFPIKPEEDLLSDYLSRSSITIEY